MLNGCIASFLIFKNELSRLQPVVPYKVYQVRVLGLQTFNLVSISSISSIIFRTVEMGTFRNKWRIWAANINYSFEHFLCSVQSHWSLHSTAQHSWLHPCHSYERMIFRINFCIWISCFFKIISKTSFLPPQFFDFILFKKYTYFIPLMLQN